MPVLDLGRVGPLRSPSFSLCVSECGGRCCTGPSRGGPTVRVWLTPGEAALLERLAAERGLTLRLTRHERPDHPIREQSCLAFEDHEHRCPFLVAGACSIHAVKPAACQVFPQAPCPGCLVWPAPEPMP